MLVDLDAGPVTLLCNIHCQVSSQGPALSPNLSLHLHSGQYIFDVARSRHLHSMTLAPPAGLATSSSTCSTISQLHWATSSTTSSSSVLVSTIATEPHSPGCTDQRPVPQRRCRTPRPQQGCPGGLRLHARSPILKGSAPTCRPNNQLLTILNGTGTVIINIITWAHAPGIGISSKSSCPVGIESRFTLSN